MYAKLETILTRMISDPAFAEAVFRDAVKALSEYGLPNEEIAKFRAMPRAEFEAVTHEFRKLLFALAPEVAERMAASQSISNMMFEP